MLTLTPAQARTLTGQPRTRNKFNARRATYHGQDFGSTKELNRFIELELLLKLGDIVELEAHPVFPLVVNGQPIGRYTADSRYVTAGGEIVIEDVKSPATRAEAAYRLRKRVFEALYAPLVITEY